MLRPRLTTLGFTGSGTTFTLPSEDHFATIGLQKSQFGDRRALNFTANVTVVRQELWAALRALKPHFAARPAPNTFYGNGVWRTRVGTLLPSGEDTWWHVTGHPDAANAADELATAIEFHALPAMQARLEG